MRSVFLVPVNLVQSGLRAVNMWMIMYLQLGVSWRFQTLDRQFDPVPLFEHVFNHRQSDVIFVYLARFDRLDALLGVGMERIVGFRFLFVQGSVRSFQKGFADSRLYPVGRHIE